MRDPFTPAARLDEGQVADLVSVAVRMLDDTIDASGFPLQEQRREATAKRRIGLGLTGLADALMMVGLRYGSPEAAAAAGRWMGLVNRAAYAASAHLAAEKGAFPLFDREPYLAGETVRGLDPEVRALIAEKGIRNALLTSIAPTGTISLLADNVSSGVEPVFAHAFTRKVLQPDGSRREELVEDYAVRLYRARFGADAPLPEHFVTAQTLTPAEHVRMQAALQRHVDSAISKTVNVPEDIAFEAFEAVYRDAYQSGCKGCTTYRPNAITGSVLAASPEPAAAPGPSVPSSPAHEPLARPAKLTGSTYKLRWADSAHALYVTINDIEEAGRKRPFEVFISSANMEHFAWVVALTRMISAVFRRGGEVAFVAEELKGIFDPRGGQWMEAAAPDLHLAEARRHRTLLVVDEVHHLPALPSDDGAGTNGAGRPGGNASPDPEDDAAGWSAALLPLLECARVRLLLSGTLERADGRRILWLSYRKGPRTSTREVDLAAPGWAVVGYSRAQALAERAVLPVTFGALDGEASWLEPVEGEPRPCPRATMAGADGAEPASSVPGARQAVGPHRLSGSYPDETTRPALFTALRTGFADALLRRAFDATRQLRAERRQQGLGPRGLGKLLVVAPDQEQARRYLGVLRGWVPWGQQETVRLATSGECRAHETLAAFRLRSEPSILVTVAMAYEGLDAPEVAVVAALTHIRSRPWLEQMIARATRVDPHAGPYEGQRALVFHPDDPLFATFRRRVETEQGTLARGPKPGRKQSELPLWLREQLESEERQGIVPLESNALALRFSTLRPGPELALRRPELEEAQQELLEPPSAAERRLRHRVGELVAIQAVEDEGEMQARPRSAGVGPGHGRSRGPQVPRQRGHRQQAACGISRGRRCSWASRVAWGGRG